MFPFGTIDKILELATPSLSSFSIMFDRCGLCLSLPSTLTLGLTEDDAFDLVLDSACLLACLLARFRSDLGILVSPLPVPPVLSSSPWSVGDEALRDLEVLPTSWERTAVAGIAFATSTGPNMGLADDSLLDLGLNRFLLGLWVSVVPSVALTLASFPSSIGNEEFIS